MEKKLLMNAHHAYRHQTEHPAYEKCVGELWYEVVIVRPTARHDKPSQTTL